MDGLSVAASVIAVADVSVNVITSRSRLQSSRECLSRHFHLETLRKGLKATLHDDKSLAKSPQGASLSTSQDFEEQPVDCQSTLQQLHSHRRNKQSEEYLIANTLCKNTGSV